MCHMCMQVRMMVSGKSYNFVKMRSSGESSGVVNQVVNGRLMLKRTWMHPGIQEPRERTEW